MTVLTDIRWRMAERLGHEIAVALCVGILALMAAGVIR
jgi:hypothetical protein